MKRFVKEISPKVAFVFLGITLSLLVFNKIFFLHNHILPNGEVITHAHPFKKSDTPKPANTHQHSKTEICILDSFEIFIFGFSAIITVSAYYRIIHRIIATSNSACSSFPNNLRKRGPPVFYM